MKLPKTPDWVPDYVLGGKIRSSDAIFASVERLMESGMVIHLGNVAGGVQTVVTRIKTIHVLAGIVQFMLFFSNLIHVYMRVAELTCRYRQLFYLKYDLSTESKYCILRKSYQTTAPRQFGSGLKMALQDP